MKFVTLRLKNIVGKGEKCSHRVSYSGLLTLSKTNIFRLKEFADDNFRFDENGRKLSKLVENIMGKGEIAHYEQYLLFPHSVFNRLVLQTRKSQGLFNPFPNKPWLLCVCS